MREREKGLPSDLKCVVCNSCIENKQICYQLEKGQNKYGDFDPFENGQKYVCEDCL